MKHPTSFPLLAILCALVALVLLPACGRKDPASTSSVTLTIGLSFETLQTEFWVASIEAFRAELAARNIRVLEAVADPRRRWHRRGAEGCEYDPARHPRGQPGGYSHCLLQPAARSQ
jgi:hypothetical protein